ncbi:MAG: FtsW/RodA/SpoVE family cell cycle protein, partial [Pseudonocardiaceae bacterium]
MTERPATTGRGVELALLVFAAGVVTLALVLVEADQKQQLSRSLLYLGVAYLGLFAVAHAAVRWLAPHADPLILPCVALLNGLGLVMIHRLDLAAATQAVDAGEAGATGDAARQVGWTAVALVLFVAVLWWVRDHRSVASYGYTAGLVGLGLLVLPGVLPARISQVNGAKLWLRLGPV